MRTLNTSRRLRGIRPAQFGLSEIQEDKRRGLHIGRPRRRKEPASARKDYTAKHYREAFARWAERAALLTPAAFRAFLCEMAAANIPIVLSSARHGCAVAFVDRIMGAICFRRDGLGTTRVIDLVPERAERAERELLAAVQSTEA